eukprot:TRINITY_DN2848_c2_g1_i1.p1 TRINITY_DN2848_c2_g1~~TRINITY_DN2848_c2_g1_i1.p1  ORF type:complete len:557 (-),score=36.38 TRINITY_DN2848_c2_g1_i1:1185-2855(-)
MYKRIRHIQLMVTRKESKYIYSFSFNKLESSNDISYIFFPISWITKHLFYQLRKPMNTEVASLCAPQTNASHAAAWEIGPKYLFVRLLGYGSYGSVCDAICVETKTRVAIKKFINVFQDSMNCKRVLREIELLYSMNNPYIVKPLDVFIRQGSDIYLVMEIGQIDLYSLGRSIFLVDKQVKVIMYRILLALNYLHSGGIVHRDIKPANILVNADCSIKLCDFGLGRSITGLTSSYFDCDQAFRKDPTLYLSEESVRSEKDLEEYSSDEKEDMNEVEDIDEGDKQSMKTFHYKFEVKFDRLGGNSKAMSITSNKVEEALPKPCTVLEAKRKEQRQILLTQSKVYNSIHERELSGHVATRCYRPPEIILLERVYTTAVDMWAAGCVFAELLEMVKENQPDISKRSPLFPGRSCFPLSPSANPTEKVLGMPVSPRDQLKVILEVFGEPSVTDLSFLNDQRAEDYVKAVATPKGKLALKERLPASDKNALDLLEKLLAFNPYYRVTAKEALRHPYFEGIRDKLQETEMIKPITLLTDTLKAKNPQILANEVLQKTLIRKQ